MLGMLMATTRLNVPSIIVAGSKALKGRRMGLQGNGIPKFFL
jgi:dihydroxyacid dehydratase/phosphogluconate dehydratase